MNNKINAFCLSIGIRGKVLGYDAIASYSRQHGENCIQGNVSVSHENLLDIVGLVSGELRNVFQPIMPEFLQDISAEVAFGNSYNYEFLKINTEAVWLSLIRLFDGGSALLLRMGDSLRLGTIEELAKAAKEVFGVQGLYLYLSSGASVDIRRLLGEDEDVAIVPPSQFYSPDGFCLYAAYDVHAHDNFFDVFLYDLFGIDTLWLFAGKTKTDSYFILSVPDMENKILTISKFYLQLESAPKTTFQVRGELHLAFIPKLGFAVNCQIAPSAISLSAAAIVETPINIFGEFYLGTSTLTIGYQNGSLIFGISGELYLRKLYLYAAIQLAASGGVVSPQLLSCSTGLLSFSALFENLTGRIITGMDALDIIRIQYFDFRIDGTFAKEDLQEKRISKIITFFNSKVAPQFSLSEDAVSFGKISGDDGYTLVDRTRMRHYYINSQGELYLRPQFYYSDVTEDFTLADGSVVSAGVFFCAKIQVMNVKFKALFSFRKGEDVLAFASIQPVDLEILRITHSDYSETNPISLPENSILYQWMDHEKDGVVFFLQASQKDICFYFDGKISFLSDLLTCQVQLYYRSGTVIINAETEFLGMSITLSFYASYSGLFGKDDGAEFSLHLVFDTHGLEERLKDFSERITKAVEKCREKINSAKQSLIDAENKVYSLHDEVNVLRNKVNSLRNELSHMGFWKRLVYAIPYGIQIAGIEVAISALGASITIAETALEVAKAAVDFAGHLSEGVLTAINSVITSITSLFFIRRLEAQIGATIVKQEIAFSAEFVVLGKEYQCSWKTSYNIKEDGGIPEMSKAFSDSASKDIDDLENGTLSNIYRAKTKLGITRIEPLALQDAQDILARNQRMLNMMQDTYHDMFGESLQDMEDAELGYLETLALVTTNADIARRAAHLEDLRDTVDELKTVTMGTSDSLKIARFNQLEQDYKEAVDAALDLGKLVDVIHQSKETIRMSRVRRKKSVQQKMVKRGLHQVQFDGAMLEYVKTLEKEAGVIYRDAPNSYTNPASDEQVKKILQKAESYFEVNS